MRLYTRAEIENLTNGERTTGRTENISVGGLRVLASRTFAPYTKVALNFSLPTGHAIETQGAVVHAQPGLHMGIRFRWLKESDRQALQAFVGEAEQITLPTTGEINQRAGVYESLCCHFVVALGRWERFPLCNVCSTAAGWGLVRPTDAPED